MQILVALDKFKDCLSSATACALVAETLRARLPEAGIRALPTSDGGEGFCEVLATWTEGRLETLSVPGPLGDPVQASVAWLDGKLLSSEVWSLLGSEPREKLAVVEMAQASGLCLLPTQLRNPWHTNTAGTGALLRAVALHGAEFILLGLGGSATNDLGLGALEALGLQAFDQEGRPLSKLRPSCFGSIASFDLAGLQSLPPLRLICDVGNPLLGPRGASAVFGPQKGLPKGEVSAMECAVEDASRKLCAAFGQDLTLREEAGVGAAGGIAFGLACAFGAQRVSGYALMEKGACLEKHLSEVDWVITGEGRFDASSLEGKGPGSLALRALELGKPVLILSGALGKDLPSSFLTNPKVQARAISPPLLPLAEALAQAPSLLKEAAAKVTLPTGLLA